MGEEKTKKLKAKVAFKHELEKHWLMSSYVPEPGEQVFYDAETGDGDLPEGRDTPYTYPRIKVGALDKDGNKISVNDLPFANGTLADGVLTIQRNGASIGTFSANQDENTQININVPTSLNDLRGSSDVIKNEEIVQNKNVPKDSASYAKVLKIGGMSYKSANLLDMNKCVVTQDTTQVVGEGTLTVTGYIVQNTITHLVAGKEYTFSAKSTRTGERGGGISIECYDSNSATVYGRYEQDVLNPNITFTVPQNAVRTRFYFYGGTSGSTTSATYTKVMLNEGPTAQPYSHYFEGLRHTKITEIKSKIESANLLQPFNIEPVTINGITMQYLPDEDCFVFNGSLSKDELAEFHAPYHITTEYDKTLEVGAFYVSGTFNSNGEAGAGVWIDDDFHENGGITGFYADLLTESHYVESGRNIGPSNGEFEVSFYFYCGEWPEFSMLELNNYKVRVHFIYGQSDGRNPKYAGAYNPTLDSLKISDEVQALPDYGKTGTYIEWRDDGRYFVTPDGETDISDILGSNILKVVENGYIELITDNNLPAPSTIEFYQGASHIIMTNSIIIGEGEAADLSIAGGTTDTSFFVATIKSNSALMEKINENPAGAMILELLENGNISAQTLNTINKYLGTNYSIVKSKAGDTMSISLGTSNESTKVGAITLGYGNKSSGFSSSAIGSENTVEGSGALAYGHGNTVSSDFGVAFGQENEAGYSALASGIKNKATGKGSFTSGYNNTASGTYSTAIGDGNTAEGNDSFATGYQTKAIGALSVAEGYKTTANGEKAHAEGFMSIAKGEASHAEGSATYNDETETWENPTTASGKASHAEGISTQAKARAAHAEGANTIVEGVAGHAEGAYTEVYSKYAHAGGVNSWVDKNADNAFVHGDNSVIKEGAKRSVAFGFHAEANHPDQFVIGRYNDSSDEDTIFAIGNGTKDSQRSNAFEVSKTGEITVAGLKIGNTAIRED